MSRRQLGAVASRLALQPMRFAGSSMDCIILLILSNVVFKRLNGSLHDRCVGPSSLAVGYVIGQKMQDLSGHCSGCSKMVPMLTADIVVPKF